MIKPISQNTQNHILEQIVSIHKQCVLESNSQSYENNQLKEWLETININNVKQQLINTRWITIQSDNAIIGFAQYSIEDKELYQIQVLPTEQGKGYGKKLYNCIEKDFINNKVDTISLYSTLNAVGFYKKFQFKEIGEIRFKLINTSLQMIKMQKMLKYPYATKRLR